MAVEVMLEAPTLRVNFEEMWRPSSPYPIDQTSQALSPAEIELLASVHPTSVSLGDIATLLAAVDTLWEVSYDLAAYRSNVVQLMPDTGEWGRAVPAQIHISRQSPMWVELVGAVGAPGSIAAATYGLLRLLIAKPERVGSAIPMILAGWHKGMTRADRAARRRVVEKLPKKAKHSHEVDDRTIPDDVFMEPEMLHLRARAVVAGDVLINGVTGVDSTGAMRDVERPD